MQNISNPVRLSVLASLIIALSGCNSGDDDGPAANPPPKPPPAGIPAPGDEPPPATDPEPEPNDPPGDTEPPDHEPAPSLPPPVNPPLPEDGPPKPPADEQPPGPPGEELEPPVDGEGPPVANSVPVISGNPPTSVVYDTTYQFQPEASDADGDILHFSITNTPPWATFERTTGKLTGTPGPEHVGNVYEGIVIAATDGAADAELEAFGITVLAIGEGSVELSWLAPTENADGSALTDLAGFRIYWGTSPRAYDQSITIDNPGVLMYQVDNLAPATYYFAATAFNRGGEESEYSGEASATIDDT